jgi:hypothetical protein
MAILTEDQIKEKLKDNEALADIIETLTSEKTKYTAKDREVLKYKSSIKKLGYNKDEHGELDTFISAMLETKNKANETDNAKGEKTELEKRLALLEATLTETKKASQKLADDNKNKTLSSKLEAELSKKLKGSNYIIKDLIRDGKVDLVDGDVVFKNGDEVVLFKDGIEQIIKDNDDLVILDQNRGGDTKNIKTNNKASLSLTSINKLTPEEIKSKLSDIKKLANVR